MTAPFNCEQANYQMHGNEGLTELGCILCNYDNIAIQSISCKRQGGCYTVYMVVCNTQKRVIGLQ